MEGSDMPLPRVIRTLLHGATLQPQPPCLTSGFVIIASIDWRQTNALRLSMLLSLMLSPSQPPARRRRPRIPTTPTFSRSKIPAAWVKVVAAKDLKRL